MTNETENSGNRDKTEKKNWFHSLSRRRKSSTILQKQQSTESSSTSASAAAALAPPTVTTSQDAPPLDDASNSNTTCGKDRKRKDERKNIFQRFKKRMSIHFSMRQKKTSSRGEPIIPPVDGIVCYPNDLLPMSMSSLDPPEMIPFTHSYRRFVTKKWLENGFRPNHAMHTACMEMLGQVWYWGEISRREAQRILKDKPIGSFLVRDSEAVGSATCWYTLSFRILNRTLHYRLEYRANYWHFEELQYESIVEMIENILHRCTKEHFVCFVRVPNELQPPMAVILKLPVSRYIQMMKLQDLCRRVIQQHVSPDQIQELQIPVKLQEYLAETPELVFQSS